MARYIKQEMPDLQGTGETKCYYRLEKRQNLSTKELLKRAGAHGILDEGILKHALSKIAEQLVEDWRMAIPLRLMVSVLSRQRLA